MSFLRRSTRRNLVLCWALGVLFLAGLVVAVGQTYPAGGPDVKADVDACLSCHSNKDSCNGKVVNVNSLASSPHNHLACKQCHVTLPDSHPGAMEKEKVACGQAGCHVEAGNAYLKSVHSRPDKVPGDHPTCRSCHSSDDPSQTDPDPHAIKPVKGRLTRIKIVALCSKCHGEPARMQRNGPTNEGINPDAVISYDESFHGKALLRFGNTKVAICTDCHKNHEVLAPTDPRAPTNRNNVAATCGQTGCHKGAKVNFAMSGANHLRLKLRDSAVLRYELLFFRVLLFGTIAGMLFAVALDLRIRVWKRGANPASGKLVATLISISFLMMVVTILLATLDVRGAFWTWVAAMAIMAFAFIAYFLRKRQHKDEGERIKRLSLALRIQHFLLMISFSLLIATGLPLRFSQADISPYIQNLFGGLAGARMTHRVAAVVLIATWCWHLFFLAYKWHKAGYSFKSWTMMPTVKDLKDVVATAKLYFGLSNEEPKFGRFQFREKMDYFAEYWGMPIMIASGFILWFPIYWGNRLPEVGLSFAYIAHSYEATLAFLAIITWHMYNAHFHPNTFPMNKVFLTGTLTREEMEREHPLELEDRAKENE